MTRTNTGSTKRLPAADEGVDRAGAAEVPPVRRLEIAQDLWHAWNTGSYGEVTHHLSKDVIVRPIELSLRSYQGFEQIATMREDLERLSITTASTPFTWEQLGDNVLVDGRSRVVRKGSVDDQRLTWLFRFRGDQVVLIETFLSHADALAACSRLDEI